MLVVVVLVGKCRKIREIMYKTVLLTQKEIVLLLDIINQKEGYDSPNNRTNTHIIKRNLMGLIPTKNNENVKSLGN
jgi:hypothetical protein